MKLEEFNKLSPSLAKEELLKCCGSTRWATKVMKHFPFTTISSLKKIADEAWSECQKEDYFEAFSHHPKIGQKELEKKFQTTKSWAENEQAGTRNAAAEILKKLAEGNECYEKNFGYIFIVCATGKTAEEMLSLLKQRLNNDAEKELQIAAAEQHKITHLRIDKLLS